MEAQTLGKRGGYLEALLTSCPVAIMATNADGVITFANKEACKLAEREMQELVGESIVVAYESLEEARETNRQLYKSGGVIKDHEARMKTKSGKIVPVRISATHLKDSAGNYCGAVGFFEKYRPWSKAEAKLKAYAEELEARLEKWKDRVTPVFEIYPGISAVVIVGSLDATRWEHVSANLLNHLQSIATQAIIIDLSTASAESDVAAQLVKTLRTIHLLGVQCLLVGVQSSLAQAMEPLLADVTLVKSFRSLDAALQAALNSVGFEIRKRD